MGEQLFSYQMSRTPQRYGIRPRVNMFTKDFLLHYHDFFEIEVIESGRLIYDVNGTGLELFAGDAIAVGPGDIHKYSVLEPTRVYRFSILFKEACGSVQRIISSIDFPFTSHFEPDKFCEISDAFYKCMKAIRMTGEFENEIIGASATIFLSMCVESRKSFDIKLSDSYLHVVRAMKFITENCTSQITLSEVAKAVSITPSYLSRIFSEINGRSFIEYLSEQRVEVAKKLLYATETSITDIAFSAGFGSFASFSRTF